MRNGNTSSAALFYIVIYRAYSAIYKVNSAEIFFMSVL